MSKQKENGAILTFILIYYQEEIPIGKKVLKVSVSIDKY